MGLPWLNTIDLLLVVSFSHQTKGSTLAEDQQATTLWSFLREFLEWALQKHPALSWTKFVTDLQWRFIQQRLFFWRLWHTTWHWTNMAQNGMSPSHLWSPGIPHDSAKVKYQTWTDGWQQELDCCCQRHQRNQQTWRVKLFHQQKSRVWGSNEIEEISISNRWHFILGGYPKWQPSRLADSLCPWVIHFYKSQGCCMLYSHKDDSKWDKQIHRKCLYNLVLKATGLEIQLSASKFSYIHVQKPQKCVLIFQYFPLSQNEFQENKTSAHLHYWITSHRENQYLFLTKQNHSLAHTLTGIGTSGWFAGLVKIWSN